MRITMLNDDLLQCDAAFALRELVKSPNPIEAASWQKLLELVDFLQSSEPDCNIDAAILLKELHLSKPSPPDPERDREFEIFLEEWRASHPDPQSWGNELVDAARPFFGIASESRSIGRTMARSKMAFQSCTTDSASTVRKEPFQRMLARVILRARK
jgi:hypothetical protein